MLVCPIQLSYYLCVEEKNIFKEQSVCCKLFALQLLHPVERGSLATALF